MFFFFFFFFVPIYFTFAPFASFVLSAHSPAISHVSLFFCLLRFIIVSYYQLLTTINYYCICILLFPCICPHEIFFIFPFMGFCTVFLCSLCEINFIIIIIIRKVRCARMNLNLGDLQRQHYFITARQLLDMHIQSFPNLANTHRSNW